MGEMWGRCGRYGRCIVGDVGVVRDVGDVDVDVGDVWGGGAERALHANDGGRCRLGHVERDCLIERLCLCEARRPAHNHRCSGCGE